MEFRGKALYSLLRSNWLKDQTIKVEPWQVEDYRALPMENLFERLKKLGFSLSEQTFALYAEKCESPEELLDFLWGEESDFKTYDAAYLLIFELWRRLLPDKRALSIFCDDLDARITSYHENPAETEEAIQDILQELEDILDQNVDLGEDPKEVFASLEAYCAYDIESFIYDYIVDQIELNNEIYASELLEGFGEYVKDPYWFDFLRTRLFANADAHEGNLMISGLLEQLEEEPDLALLLEICSFLVHAGDPSLFVRAVKQAIPQLKSEEDFQELLRLIAEYFRCLDKEEKAESIQTLLKARASKNPADIFDPRQVDFNALLLEDAQWDKV